MRFSKKTAVVLALSASALIGTAAISAVPAQADTAQQRAAAIAEAPDILCSGDVCIQDFMGYTTQWVHAWADKHSFYGHFEDIFGCSVYGCNVANSPQGEWPAGGKHYIFALSSAVSAQCVIAWKGTKKTGWKDIGKKCFNPYDLNPR